MTHALERDDAEQVVGRVAHVGAVGAGAAVGNPEQTEESEHVIDAQRAGVAKAAAQQIDEVLDSGRAGAREDRSAAIPSSGRSPRTDRAARRRSRRARTDSGNAHVSAPAGELPIARS